MKARTIFFVLSLSFTAVAALRHKDEPTAEKVYKNIKTLTGTPAGDVIPAMKFMCASLKVDCGYCHTEDFASDAKHMKEVARHMIEMQRDINLKNFRGQNQVTCNTCHNGSPNPQRSPVIAGFTRRSIKRDGAPAVFAEVLKKYQAATGGSLKSVAFEGTVSGIIAQPIPLKLTQAAPNKFVLEFGGRRFGFDGTTTWSQVGTAAADQITGGDAAQIQHIGRVFRGEHAFDSLGEMRFAGRDKVDGKDVVVFRSGGQNSKISEDFYFDEQSGLLVRIGTYTTTVFGSMPEVTDFSDFRRVDGSLIPFKISTQGTKETFAMQFTKATPNPALGEGFFAKPADGGSGKLSG